MFHAFQHFRACVREKEKTDLRTHVFLARVYKSSGTYGTSGTQLFLFDILFFKAGTELEQSWNTVMSAKKLRESMPLVTAFIDECREVFGAEAIHQSIRAGLDGQETFWARENGIEIGTRPSKPFEACVVPWECR